MDQKLRLPDKPVYFVTGITSVHNATFTKLHASKAAVDELVTVPLDPSATLPLRLKARLFHGKTAPKKSENVSGILGIQVMKGNWKAFGDNKEPDWKGAPSWFWTFDKKTGTGRSGWCQYALKLEELDENDLENMKKEEAEEEAKAREENGF